MRNGARTVTALVDSYGTLLTAVRIDANYVRMVETFARCAW